MLAKKIVVTGLVQGVGFRPAVAELAEKCRITGSVKNMGGAVEIYACGTDEAVEKFLHRLKLLSGKVGRMDALKVWDVPFNAACTYFKIEKSSMGKEAMRLLPADFPTCERCRKELFNKKNRRYRYPFISCTQCGPRYSIQKAVPYDRDSITMDCFPMCPVCEKEYTQKGNIRRHAQTIACPDCGPTLRLVGKKADTAEFFSLSGNTEQILETTVNALKEEKIVAIKDIGGFHFAFSPASSRAAQRLRIFKQRDKKPFAVMFSDMDAIKEYCEVSEKEETLLTSQARPIVLLKKKKDFVPEICGKSDRIGAFLPCNPLQILLLEKLKMLVMTSGNRGGEPIIVDGEEMKELMKAGCPDMMLTHDREIVTPLDDSVYQVNGRFVQLIRRARGLVPEPIELPAPLQKDTFAAGGDLKAVFALGHGKMAYLSQYFGDLEEVRCMKQRMLAIERMEKLLEISPKRSVGDLHPAYVSAQGTQKRVQHHMAHAASVMAEHGLSGKILGIVCDGTGFGTDGTIWGSEFFVCRNEKMKRVGHFSAVKLLGGDAGAKEADKALFSYRMQGMERGLDVTEMDAVLSGNLQLQEAAWKQNLNTAVSSSMGRLFDAASALLDVCHYNSYEGECAILLELAAYEGEKWLSHLTEAEKDAVLEAEVLVQEGLFVADSIRLLSDLAVLKKKYGKKEHAKECLAYFFHHAVAKVIVTIAEMFAEEYNEVVLSGGSFMNRILLSEVSSGLEQKGLEVYTNEKVPCGDGGIALGQLWLSSFEE